MKNRKCPICSSDNYNLIKKVEMIVPKGFLLSGSFDLVSCLDCGFVYSNFDDKEEFGKYYASYTSICNGNYSINDGLKILNDRTVSFIEKYTDINSYVLDIGCSYGVTLLSLKNKGYKNIYGVDLDNDAINYLKSNNINASIGSIDNFVSEYSNKFDLVVLRHIVEHLINPSEVINIISKYLKPNGKIYIESPNLALYYLSNDFPGYFIEYEHINHFSLESLNNLMSEYNLIASNSYSDIYPTLMAIYQKHETNKSPFIKTFDSELMIKSLSECNHSGDVVYRNLDRIKYDNIAIWGVSTHVYRVLTHTILKDLNIKLLVDSNPIIQNQEILGMHVMNIDTIDNFDGTILICGRSSYNSIMSDIKKRGIRNKIVWLYEEEEE